MPDQKKGSDGAIGPATAAEVVRGAVGKVTDPEAVGALTELVGAVRETVQIWATESTKREKLKTYRETEVARISQMDHDCPKGRGLAVQKYREKVGAVSSGS